MTTPSYHIPQRRYTRQQARIGGIRSGATRRFNSRNRHAEIRRLHAKGLTQAAIAAAVGYSQGTVSKIIRGVIKTCLSLAESAPITAKRAADAVKQWARMQSRNSAGYSRTNPILSDKNKYLVNSNDIACRWCNDRG